MNGIVNMYRYPSSDLLAQAFDLFWQRHLGRVKLVSKRDERLERGVVQVDEQPRSLAADSQLDNGIVLQLD